MFEVENFKRSAKVTILLGVVLITAIVLFVFSFLVVYTRRNLYLILSAIFFAMYILLLIKRFHYFSLTEQGDSLLIRFYNPHPFISDYKKIVIKKSEYDGYEIKKRLFSKDIIFHIKRDNKKGKYPAVSISGLTREEQQKLISFLDNLKQHK